MKKLIALCSIAFLFACSSNGGEVEVGKKTTLEVNDIFDAGTVVKGEVIRAVFTVKNTGDYPLVFGEVRPSCSCTVPHKPEEPIQPGETGEIVAQVMTDQLITKNVTKSITLLTNTEPSTTVLVLKAVIK